MDESIQKYMQNTPDESYSKIERERKGLKKSLPYKKFQMNTFKNTINRYFLWFETINIVIFRTTTTIGIPKDS